MGDSVKATDGNRIRYKRVVHKRTYTVCAEFLVPVDADYTEFDFAYNNNNEARKARIKATTTVGEKRAR